jgi:hypothetical protein
MNKANQEAFDVMVNHLRQQNEKAESGLECRYRAWEEGVDVAEDPTLMCALGCLISDETYHEDMEGLVAHELLAKFGRSILGEHSKCDLDFLQDMQSVHDNMKVSKWDDGFKEAAKKWNLKVPRRSRKKETT